MAGLLFSRYSFMGPNILYINNFRGYLLFPQIS